MPQPAPTSSVPQLLPEKVVFACLLIGSLFGLPTLVQAQVNEGNLVSHHQLLHLHYADTDSVPRGPATLKGRTFTCFLDTGFPTYISAEVQARYHFPYLAHASLTDGGGKQSGVDIVRLDTLRFGPFIFTDIPALVLNLKDSPVKCDQVSGNVGSNIFRFLFMQFDVAAGMLAFTDEESLLPQPLAQPHRFWLNQQSDVYFSIALNTQLADTIQFDTGDKAFYAISPRKARQVSNLFPQQVAGTGYGVISMGISGLNAPFQQLLLKPEQIQVGSTPIAHEVLYLSGNGQSRLGRRLLKYGILTLAYPRQQYSFAAYSAPKLPQRTDFGFYPVVANTKVLVGTVWRRTPAATLGVQVGDELLAVNGIRLASLPECQLETVLSTQLHHEQAAFLFRSPTGKRKQLRLVARKL